MLMFKKIMSLALVLVMVAGMLPAQALASEMETVSVEETTPVMEETTAATEAAAEETTGVPAEEPVETETVPTELPEETEAADMTEAVTEPAARETLPEEMVIESVEQILVPDGELPDNEELRDAYLTRLFYGNDMAFFGTNARERLTEVEKHFYDLLRAEILKIAAGERTSTRIEISKDALVEWGMTVSFDTTGAANTTEMANIAHKGLFDQINQRNIINALMYDCPYEMYWYDKTAGTLISSGCSISGNQTIITRVMFSFRVVGDMKPNGYDANNPTIDTSFVTTAKASAAAAQAIVDKYAALEDYEKLVAYKDEICALTSYNNSVATSSVYTTDADPWQLIYVFDGDSRTTVVCEGYSKAFQYLFDLSAFRGDVASCIVVGALDGGGHMWNIVSIDGKNYIADVTNSDSGTAGANGGLFLAGGSGSVTGGYRFLGHNFTYTDTTIELWGEEILTLAASDYTPYVASGTCGDNLTWILDDEGTLTISGSGAMTNYSGYSSVPWYSYRSQIKNVVLPDGITSIGNYAFYNYDGFQEILLPEGLTTLGTYAFYECDGLTSIVIPASVTSIGYYTFAYIDYLTAIYFEGDAPSIDNYAFYNVTAAAFYPSGNATWTDEVKQNYGGTIRWAARQAVNVIASGTCGDNLTWSLDDTHTLTVTGTGDMTSYGWDRYDTYIETVVIGDGVTSIASYAFNGASNLQSVTMPDTVTKIGYQSFQNCTALTQIDLPASLTTIDTYAFENCASLTTLSIPDSVTSVSSYAFRNCTALKTVSVSDKTQFGGSVFSGDQVEMYIRANTGILSQSCVDNESGIVKLVLDEAITTVEQYAFQSMSDLVEVQLPKNLTAIPNGLFYNCQKLKTVNLHNQLMSIGDYAFYNCDGLTEVTIPNSVTTLGTNLFNDCDSLTKVTLPASCKSVSNYMFYGCDKLESIQLPALVTSIGSCAFAESGITTIGWPNNLQTINSNAFYNCDKLTSISIPETVTSLYSSVFQNCDKLTSAKLPSGLTVLNDYLFDNCLALESIEIPEGVTEIGYAAFRNCDALKSVDLPDVLKEIDSYAFYDCDGLSNVTLPEGLTDINSYAFYDCSALASITIPDSVTYLGSYSFYNCDALKSAKLSDALTQLYSSMFYDCDALTAMTIPDSITSLESSCFQGCDALTEVSFGIGLTVINDSAFKDCASLTEIHLPRFLTSIRANAFSVCPNLVKVSVPATVTSIEATAFSYPDRLVIYGLPGTYAETFANNNGYRFVDGTTPATSITLSETVLTLNRGASKTVYATVLPENHTETVSWKSGNTSVATVTDKGVVKALGVGTATIKVVAGNVSASFTVTVVEPVSNISLNYSSRSLEALATFQLTASVSPSNANNKTLAWSSSDDAVAKVDQTGLVTALKKGTATITAAATDGSNVKRSCTITVTNNGYAVTDPTQMETSHNYANNCTDFWVYTMPDATSLEVTFDSRTMIEDGFDFVKIFDCDGVLVGTYTGAALAGATIEVPGDTVKIQLDSDDSGNDWGFKVTEIKEKVIVSGSCGSGLVWNYDGVTLTISGTGAMEDYANAQAPWYHLRKSMTAVVIESGVTSIGAYAFGGCTALKTITFNGNPVAISSTAFTGVTATAYYPAVNSSWTGGLGNCGGSITWKASCHQGHTEVTDKAVAPTCTGTGLTEGKHCSVCGEVLIAQTQVPATGHSYDSGSITTNPGCVTEGVKTYTCTVCRHSYTESVAATGHSYDSGSITTNPGCVTEGVKTYTCTVCRHSYTESVAATGHTAVSDAAVAPTCTETGLTEGSHCSVCKETLVAQKQVPATGHTAATDAAVAPTCTETGLTEGSHCSVCFAVIVAQEEIPANGHTFVNSFCTVCGAPDTLEGTCGSGLTWLLDGHGNLTISGQGEMSDNPWIDHAQRIKTIVIEEGVRNVDYHAFDGCINLTEVTLPGTLTEIDSYAFQNCSSLTEISFPGNLEEIGSGAFAGCAALKEILIPEGVTSVGSWAFEGCTNLTSVKIPSTLAVLESYLFRDCISLTEVVIPEGITEMWNSVFSRCTALKRVQLPESLTSVSYDIFSDCTSLETVNIPSKLKVIGEYMFSGCVRLKTVTIPKAVTTIGANAFWGSGLTEITIPAAVTEIGVGAFSNCQNLSGITVASGNKMYSNDAVGALHNKNKTQLLQIPGSFTGTFVVPNTVAMIGQRAAAFCHGLTGITIPEGVTTIGNSAFFRNNGLKEAIIPASVTLIDKYAFEECTALTSVTIRGGRTEIRESAFAECAALKNIWFKDDAPGINSDAFYGVTATAHYPAGNPTWTADVMQSYGGTITWQPQYEVEEVVSIQTDKKDLWPGDVAVLTAILDPGVRGDVEILWSLEGSADAEAELIPSGLGAVLQCYNVTKRTSVTVTARTAEGDAAPATIRITLRPEGQEDADYTIFSGKSLQLTAYDPDTGKALKAKDVIWQVMTHDEAGNLVEADAFATISTSGKLTAKKVYEAVRLEVSHTIIATGEVVSCLVDILPAVTQAEVLCGDEVVNGETILMDFTSQSKTFDLAVYPEDTLANVTWTVSDAKKQQYAVYTIDGDTLTVSNPTGKAGTVTVKAVADAGVKKNISFKIQFGSFAKTVEIMEPGVRSIRGGETLNLFAEITEPGSVTKPGIVWSVSDKNAATISNGKLKAKNVLHPTAVTVTATSKDGLASDSIDIEILPKNEGALALSAEGGYVTNGTLTVNVLQTLQLSAWTMSGSNAFAENVIWTSSKPAVAMVSEDGLVTCMDLGTAKITAQAADGRKATVTIKVSVLAKSMELTTKDGKNLAEENGAAIVVISSGKSVNLVANVSPHSAAKAVTWEIEEGGAYAKLSTSGKLTANKDLTKPVYVTVRAVAKDGSGCAESIRVKILPAAQGVQIYENGIRMRSNTTYICDMGRTPALQLRAKVYPAGADQTAELTSSNKKVADFVDGELVCYKPGTVTITAKALDGSNQKATFKLTIVIGITGLNLKDSAQTDRSGNLFVAGGKSLKLTDQVEITPHDATNKKLTWSVSPNEAGITVSNGVLKTKKVSEPVTVNVMGISQDGTGEMVSFNVTVYPATTKVSILRNGADITGTTIILEEGETLKLTGYSQPENAADVYSWTSSSNVYATVSEDGAVTAERAGQTVTITCKAEDGSGKKATVKVQIIVGSIKKD